MSTYPTISSLKLELDRLRAELPAMVLSGDDTTAFRNEMAKIETKLNKAITVESTAQAKAFSARQKAATKRSTAIGNEIAHRISLKMLSLTPPATPTRTRSFTNV